MKTVPKVVLIRQLIQIIFRLKGSKAATVRDSPRYRRAVKDRNNAAFTGWRSCRVCQTKLWSGTLDSLKMSRQKSRLALFSLWQNVRPLRLAPLSMHCQLILFSPGLAEMARLCFICWGEVKGISYQSPFEVLLSRLAGTCAMLPSVSLNCSFLLITSLTSSFSTSHSLFSLALLLSIPLSLMLTL